MPTTQLNLTQTLTALSSGEYPAQWAQNIAMLNGRGLSVTEFAAEVERVTDGYVKPTFSKSGNILGYNVRGYPSVTTPAVGTNSNAVTVARGEITAPISTATEAGSTAVRASRLSGVGTKLVTGASKLALPLTLASIGITLGKTIDEAAYNANPDFWNSIGAESVNPQTWSSIAGGDDTPGGAFINALFGIDPDTGETQAYMSADAMAYLAYCMQQAGIFAKGVREYDYNSSEVYQNYRVYSLEGNTLLVTDTTTGKYSYFAGGGIASASSTVYIGCYKFTTDTNQCIFASSEPFTYNQFDRNGNIVGTSSARQSTYYNKTVYYGDNFNGWSSPRYVLSPNIEPSYNSTNVSSTQPGIVAWLMVYGINSEAGGISGIGDQDGATLPNLDGLTESEILPALQQQYPDMFNNAINYPVVQPDGTVKNYQYVPITLPFTSNPTDTQPTSGGQSQAQPSIDPNTATDTLTELLTKVLQQPMEQPITDTPNPPANPTDTGEGSSPVPIAPTGSASSLWKIYHPTQAEVNSFGAWLWSPDFIDQVLKIFNNPMESIIGLHKVYATPIDAGTSTIHVGYLDSGVSSAYIEQQYVDVDCGTVSLYEQFGNALDYIATDVKLYLPFVGIVPLNVNEVMRSSINVSYGVDVLTGACLARVKVSRDGNSSIMYQYSGNCAVQYPISSGSYMGIVSSILGIAGSVAATVATGGGVAPLAIGAASAAMGAHTSVQNSGNFSGNAGAMGGKVPYLIVERAQAALATDFPSFEGYPANDKVKISNCSGFVRGKVSHIVGVNATDTELDEIAEYIASGILV